MEGNVAVESGDDIWIVFGCPTPMVLRRDGSHFRVVSPVLIHGIMEGEAVKGVTSPDLDMDDPSGWARILKTGHLKPRSESPYKSGRKNWLIRLISLY